MTLIRIRGSAMEIIVEDPEGESQQLRLKPEITYIDESRRDPYCTHPAFFDAAYCALIQTKLTINLPALRCMLSLFAAELGLVQDFSSLQDEFAVKMMVGSLLLPQDPRTLLSLTTRVFMHDRDLGLIVQVIRSIIPLLESRLAAVDPATLAD